MKQFCNFHILDLESVRKWLLNSNSSNFLVFKLSFEFWRFGQIEFLLNHPKKPWNDNFSNGWLFEKMLSLFKFLTNLEESSMRLDLGVSWRLLLELDLTELVEGVGEGARPLFKSALSVCGGFLEKKWCILLGRAGYCFHKIAKPPYEKFYLSLWLDRCFMIHLTVISVALWMMSAEFWEIGTSVRSTSVLLIVRFNDSSSPC